MNRLAPLTALLVLAGGGAGCTEGDGTSAPPIRFSHPEVISIYPARAGSDGWEPACTGPADGFLANVVLRGETETVLLGETYEEAIVFPGRAAWAADEPTDEPPRSFRTEDVDSGGLSITAECLNRHRDNNLTACGLRFPSQGEAEPPEWVARGPEPRAGHHVILLVDQSGSMGGIVNANRGFEEVPPDAAESPRDFNPQVASDQVLDRRSAARRFAALLAELPVDHRFAAIAFSEAEPEGLRVECRLATGDFDADLEQCFFHGALDDWYDGPLASRWPAIGRSNLWHAVDVAYDFLSAHDDGRRSNHIVVLTDGPDTAAATETMAWCGPPSSTTTAQQVLERLGQQRMQDTSPVHIHFVQFEAEGYPGPDPLQMAVACASGGHHQFIGSSRLNSNGLRDSLVAAIFRLRNAMPGHFQLGGPLPPLAATDSQAAAGQFYRLRGSVSLTANTGLVSADQRYPFGAAPNSDDALDMFWDERPTLMKRCTSDVDCGVGEPAGACTVVCSPETGLCRDGAPTYEGAPCTTVDGGAGACCDGHCLPAEARCDACD